MQSTQDRWFARIVTHDDLQALGRVFDSVAPTLHGLARHMAAGCDPDDLVQSTFLTEIETSQSYNIRRGVEHWLLGIVAVHAQERELAAAFDASLATLPADRRDVIDLRMKGLTAREIAERLDRPAGTVHAQLSRAMAFLRGRLPAIYGAGLGVAGLRAAGLDASRMRTTILEHAATRAATTASVTPWIIGAVHLKRSITITCLVLSLAVGITYLGIGRWSPSTPRAGRCE